MGGRFVEQFGGPANEQVLVLPLALKDKVAALVYADGGQRQAGCRRPGIAGDCHQRMVRVISLRKLTASREDTDAPSSVERAAPPVQTVSSFSDPFATTRPSMYPPAFQSSPNLRLKWWKWLRRTLPVRPRQPRPLILGGLSPEDADVHRKAQRFRAASGDEIKLYNQRRLQRRRNKTYTTV